MSYNLKWNKVAWDDLRFFLNGVFWKKHHFKKKRIFGMHCGTAGLTCAWDSWIPHWSGWDGVPYPFLIQLSAYTYRKQKTMAKVFELLPPIWKTLIELRGPGFSLVQSWLLEALGKCTNGWNISFCLSASLFLFVILPSSYINKSLESFICQSIKK